MVDELAMREGVRKRPGMYVGDTTTGRGVLQLVLELVANAYDQHLAGGCSSVEIDVAADGMITISDDGPGMPAAGGRDLPPLAELLTRVSQRPTVDGHRPHVHLGSGGLGLCVVNLLSERFEISTVCDGVEARAIYSRGEPVETVTAAPTTRPRGTVVRFRPDSTIFACPRVPRVELARHLEDLAFLAPGMALSWRIGGDGFAASGLSARVAIGVPCVISEVASLRALYDTAKGPIDVEIALAWGGVNGSVGGQPKPEIDSFVNLQRTRGDGRHVDGLLDGIAAFLGGKRRKIHLHGLVAVVAVVLADVKFGNPTRDRLDTPEARAPVADATRRALAAWADAHPATAEALRQRMRS